MKKFMAIYLGKPSTMAEWNSLPEAEKKKRHQAGFEAWMKWGKEHSKSIVDVGSPLGKTKKIERSGISDTKNAIGAYTIVMAESYEEAAKMFKNHPHFTIFPGDSVEIMECLPIPKPEV